MKKESRSMSQPTGLDEKVPGKSKKSLTYWFQPWKWKKQNSRTSVDAAVPPPDVTDNSTSSDNNAVTSDRTRRNSGNMKISVTRKLKQNIKNRQRLQKI